MSGHLLFLNTAYLHKISSLVAARELGLTVTVLGPELQPWARPYVDRFIEASTQGVDELHHALPALRERHRELPFDGVVTFWDHGVVPAGWVADALGLPSSSAEAAETARNKARMREALQARGVPQPRFRRVKGWEDLQAAASEIGYPLIYKPTGGAGSAGVYRVGTPQELRPAFERSLAYLSPGSGQFFAYYPFEFLVEEFMEGREVSVEGVVAHGRVLTAAVTDKWATPENFTEYRHAIPARLEPEVEREVLEVARAGVSAVGLDGCGFHAEVMITGEGCRVVEINGRLGGDMIASHLVPLATGVDLVKASLLAAMGREPDLAPSRTAGSCIRYLLAQREGVVTGWRGVSHLGLLPGVRLFCMDKYVGDTVLLPPKSFFDLRLCFVVTEGSDAGEAIGRADAALDGVECEIGTEDPALAPSQR